MLKWDEIPHRSTRLGGLDMIAISDSSSPWNSCLTYWQIHAEDLSLWNVRLLPSKSLITAAIVSTMLLQSRSSCSLLCCINREPLMILIFRRAEQRYASGGRTCYNQFGSLAWLVPSKYTTLASQHELDHEKTSESAWTFTTPHRLSNHMHWTKLTLLPYHSPCCLMLVSLFRSRSCR